MQLHHMTRVSKPAQAGEFVHENLKAAWLSKMFQNLSAFST